MERELRLIPGCCPACQEPITSRQRTHRTSPASTCSTHSPRQARDSSLRRKCERGAAAYEKAWVAADSTRQRSLLTLACNGTMIVHGDGSGECFGAIDSDCPSTYAHHRSYMACYLQSNGCGRGCSRANHAGTQLAHWPSHPRGADA